MPGQNGQTYDPQEEPAARGGWFAFIERPYPERLDRVFRVLAIVATVAMAVSWSAPTRADCVPHSQGYDVCTGKVVSVEVTGGAGTDAQAALFLSTMTCTMPSPKNGLFQLAGAGDGTLAAKVALAQGAFGRSISVVFPTPPSDGIPRVIRVNTPGWPICPSPSVR